jgi:hypothetical protein
LKLKGFIGPGYTLRTVNFDCQRCVNLFPEKDELQTGKEQEVAMLCGVPGFTLQHVLPRSPIRAVYFTANGYIYAVAGNGLYNLTVTSDGIWAHTLIGYLNTSTGPVSIRDGVPNVYNGIANTGLINQVVVVDGSTTGLCFEEGTTQVYQLSSDNGYAGSNFVTFQDGFFLFAQSGTISAYYANDPLNISDLDVINVNLSSDQVSRVISDHDIVWIFSNRTLSVWQNTGGSSSSNVFQQIPGAEAEGGCNAPASIAQVAGQLIWTTNDDRGYGMVCTAFGYRGVRISNHAVEDWLQSVGDISGATAWTYQEGGHSFYCLNVPGSSSTWCYDTVTQMWCERQFFADGVWSRDLIACHCNVYIAGIGTIHLVGDYQTGNLYKLDDSNYTFNGTPISRIRTSPHMSGSLKRVFYSSFQLDVEAGVGLDGNGFQVQQGTTGAPYTQTASGTLLAGDSPFTFLGTDGTPQIPTTVPTITALVPTMATGFPNWSGTYSINYTTGTLTMTAGTLETPVMALAPGNGVQYNFTLPNLYNLTLASGGYQIWVNDWRGNNLQYVYPAVNKNWCTSSYDFNYAGIWTLTGVNAVPSSWASVTSIAAANAYRPSSSSASGVTLTNGAYAYDRTGLTVKTSGDYASTSLDGGSTGSPVSGSVTYAGFSGSSFSGTLNLYGLFQSSVPPSYNLPVVVTISADGYASEQTSTWSGTTNTLLSTFISVKDLTTLSVTVTLYSMVFTSYLNLYDIVLLDNSLVLGSNSIPSPDGNSTGTMLTEDKSSNYHLISFTYPVTLPQVTGLSCYALVGDTNRYLHMMLKPIRSGTYVSVCFNLSNGTVQSSSGGSPTITPYVFPTQICTGMIVGNKYKIMSLGNTTFRNYGTLVSGTDNTVGAIYACTAVPPSGQAGTVQLQTPGIYRCWINYTENSASLNGMEAIIAMTPNPSAGAIGYSADYYNGNGKSCIGIWGVHIDTIGASSPPPLVQTSGEVAEDYITYTPGSGNLAFNIPPLGSVTNTNSVITMPAATITGQFYFTAVNVLPTEFNASFSYLESAPNYVTIGTNPQVGLSYSDDGGHTFCPERLVPLGGIGSRLARAIWRRLGMSRDRVFRVTCSDPVKFAPIGAEIDAKVGDA